jgi:hypothetical protein
MTGDRLRLVAVIAVAVALGFLIGTWRSGVTIETGRADSTANGGGSISTDGWTYGFSSDTAWTDASNSWHDSGLPDCLPPLSSVEGVRFAWVQATVEGVSWRPVIWIDCRSVAQP